jgi:hypothetical protein
MAGLSLIRVVVVIAAIAVAVPVAATAVRGLTALAGILPPLFGIHGPSAPPAALAMTMGRRAVAMCRLGVPIRFVGVAGVVVASGLPMMVGRRLMMESGIAVMVPRAAPSAGSALVFAARFVTGPAPMRSATAFAGDLTLFVWIHGGEPAFFLYHCSSPLPSRLRMRPFNGIKPGRSSGLSESPTIGIICNSCAARINCQKRHVRLIDDVKTMAGSIGTWDA